MVGGEICTLSVCVYSAELDTAANGAYCKVYVDANDRTKGSGGAGGGGSSSTANSDATSPDTSRGSDQGATPARSFHTHVEKSDKKTYLPTWNETFTIDVFDRRSEILTIRLKSKKMLHVSVVGACAIPLHQIPTGRPVDQWFPVQKGGKRRGKLRLQMMITFPQAPLAAVGQPSPSQDPRRQDVRRSMDQRSSGSSASMYQRPSSLSSQPSEYTPPSRPAQAAPAALQNGNGYGNQYQQQQHATLSTYRYEPEDEPLKEKEKLPFKEETYEMYRPATNPRLTDLESDDDDETAFPRVAELHRLESDLMGESSDEDVDPYDLVPPKSPLYLEPLTEDISSEEHSTSFTAKSATAVVVESRDSLKVDDLKPSPEVTDSKLAVDRRASVEILRRKKVVMPEEDVEHMLELSTVTTTSYDDVDEATSTNSPAHSDISSDVAVGQVVAIIEEGKDVWNQRYSSSSSEELQLQLPYPDDDEEKPEDLHSTGSGSIQEGIPVEIYDADLFVESASPNHSSRHSEDYVGGEKNGSYGTPRDSLSSDGENQHESIDDDVASASSPTRVSGVHEDPSSPRNSWVSDSTPIGQDVSPRSSWVSEEVAGSATARMTGRDKTWSGTSWISEAATGDHTPHKDASPRSSWVSEQPETHTATPVVSKTTSGRDKSWSGTSWVSEEQHSASAVVAVATHEESSPRHSWVSDKSDVYSTAATAQPRARLTGRDKTWSGTSWINENDNSSFIDATGPRSSWVSEDGKSHVPGEDEGDTASPRHSWVSDATSETPARLTGRDKSWSGTSWISEQESSSFAETADVPEKPRSHSTTSESADSFDAVADTTARTSWIHEDGAPPVVRLTGRDKSWSGTSWISERDNTSFIDATGLRSSWMGEDADAEAVINSSSPRHSWVSDADTESPARRPGLRDKTWSGTSWVSEDGDNAGDDEGAAAARHSWVSETVSEAPARLTGRDKSWSGTSWVSEQETTSFVDASGPPATVSPRSSWIREAASPVPDSRSSWISETASPVPDSRTSWISEAASPVPDSRTSWISEAETFKPASPRHSWVSEAGQSSAIDQNTRSSWVSESATSTASRRPVSPRTSWVDEKSDAASPRYRLSSSQTSWVNEQTNAHSFVSDSLARHSFVSDGSVEDEMEPATETVTGVAILPAPAQDSIEMSSPPRVSVLSEISDLIEGASDASPHSSISAEPSSQTDTFVSERISSTSSVEITRQQQDTFTTGSPRGSYSSNEGNRHEERLSMEDLLGSPSSGAGRSSGYEADNMETSTTRSSSLFSDQARDRDFDGGREGEETRRSSFSSSAGEAYDHDHPSSYTDLTRPSSLSSAGGERIVVHRDNAEMHAEAVAEAARYSSSSEDDRQEDFDSRDIPSVLNIKAPAPRRYSSASEEDTVDRSSNAVYDNLSTAGRSQSSSVAARDEAQFVAWTEASSTYGDFSDAMRRGSEVSSISDMYDASPRGSEDVGESQARVSMDSCNSAASLEISEPMESSTHEMRRFVSMADMLVEPYEDDTPRSSDSNVVVPSAHVTSEAAAATSSSTVEDVKVTVIVEEAEPAPVNPFVEAGSSSSSEEETHDEVVVIETVDQLDRSKVAATITTTTTVIVEEAVVETNLVRVDSVTSDHSSAPTAQSRLDSLATTREYVDNCGKASPVSLLSVARPHDPVVEKNVVTAVSVQETTEISATTPPSPAVPSSAPVTVQVTSPLAARTVASTTEEGCQQDARETEAEATKPITAVEVSTSETVKVSLTVTEQEVVEISTKTPVLPVAPPPAPVTVVVMPPTDARTVTLSAKGDLVQATKQIESEATKLTPAVEVATSETVKVSSPVSIQEVVDVPIKKTPVPPVAPPIAPATVGVTPPTAALTVSVSAKDELEQTAKQIEPEATKSPAVIPVSTSEAIEISPKLPVPPVASPPAALAVSVAPPSAARTVAFSVEAETKSDAPSTSVGRQNLRGDHMLVSMASTLTRAQLQAVALDHLPSDDESDDDSCMSDEFNFDSDTDE